MGIVVDPVKGTIRKFSSCGPAQEDTASTPAMIDKIFFAFIIFHPFRGLDNAANLFSMFHDAFSNFSGMYGRDEK